MAWRRSDLGVRGPKLSCSAKRLAVSLAVLQARECHRQELTSFSYENDGIRTLRRQYPISASTTNLDATHPNCCTASILKGLCPPAQGCPARREATLGNGRVCTSTPKELCH